MNREQLEKLINDREEQVSLALPSLMRKVYTWMTLALVITGITAYGVASSPNLIYSIATNKLLFWGLIIAELALVFSISARIQKLSLGTATLMFIAYSVLNGVTLSFIFMIYTTNSIAQVFFISAATFGAMSLFGYKTKTNLSFIGRFALMALIGIIIASVVNIFVGGSGFQLIISYIAVVVFVALTAYDTQKIKALLAQADDINEESQKIALLGSLTLYLDFINLFIYLLRILGDRK